MCKLNDFLTDTQEIALIPEHIRAFSGRSTIGKYEGSVTGAQRFYCPPVTAQKMAFTMKMDVVSHGLTVLDNALTGHGIGAQMKLLAEKWHPSYLWRKGVVHEYLGGQKELNLWMETWVVPSAVDDAFYLKMKIVNTSGQPVALELSPDWKELCFADATGQEWGWNPPCSEISAERLSGGIYRGENLYLSLLWSTESGRSDSTCIALEDGECRVVILKALFSSGEEIPAQGSLEAELAESIRRREEKWEEYWKKIPHLKTSHPGLDKAWLHSLLILFLIRWDSPHFIFEPFYAEAGLCGRSVCAYTWGEAYISRMMMLVDKEAYRKNILAHLFMDLDAHYAVDPITGKGLGPCYNYNLHSAITIVRDYVNITGDRAFLAEPVHGLPLYRMLVNLVEEVEGKSDHYGELLDYGDHHNLLEMRGSGYEHIVPSPNGERVVIYRYLAEILEAFGHGDESALYRQKAERVKKDLSAQLWDEDAGWFKCRYPDGHEEMVYSIQIFDLLGQDILSPGQEKAIIAHINDAEFLSAYGVNSVSKLDCFHFDLGDVDWSGAGAYAGDPCNLIEVLFRMGEAEKAWDVTGRILWWSDKYPYWPQAIWAGKQEYSHWETPICKCGVAFAQAILFGMLGMKTENGTVTFDPRIPEAVGSVTLSNVKAFGKTFGGEWVK